MTTDVMTTLDLDAVLAHAVRAPSVLNTQPWRFEVEETDRGPSVHIWADRDRQLTALDPDGRELAISVGAAVFYLATAARHAGWTPTVTLNPDGDDADRLASVTLRPGPPPNRDDRTFRALGLRRTNRLPFADEPIPWGVLDGLEEHAAIYGVRLHVLEGEAQAALAALVEEGVLTQAERPEVTAEIQAWLRPDGDPRPDGVRDEAQGIWDRRATLRTPAVAVADYKRRLLVEAPVAFVLATASDTTDQWLRTGQALASVLVHAADRGLAASYANEPVEERSLRPRVAALVGGGAPQVVFRVGYPQVDPPTPRRALRDVRAV